MTTLNRSASFDAFDQRVRWILHRTVSEAEGLWDGYGYDAFDSITDPRGGRGTPDGDWYIVQATFDTSDPCADVPSGGYPLTVYVTPDPIPYHADFGTFPQHLDSPGRGSAATVIDCACTRLYLSSAVAGVAGQPYGGATAPGGFTDDAGWEHVASSSVFMLANEVPSAPPSANTPWSHVGPASTDDFRQNQYLFELGAGYDSSGDLLALIQAGGGTVRMQARARSRYGIGISEASQDVVSQLSVRVIAPDGTVRGTALAMHGLSSSAGSAKWPAQATYVNRVFPPEAASNALSAVGSAQAGDYLVVEPGGRTFYTGPTGGTTELNEDPGNPDLPEDEDTTSAWNSWLDICS